MIQINSDADNPLYPTGLPLYISPTPCTYTLCSIRTPPTLMPLPPLSLLSPFQSTLLPSLTQYFSSFPACFTHLLHVLFLSSHPPPPFIPLSTLGYTIPWYSLCIYHYGSQSGLRAECSCSLCPYCQLCNGAHDILALKASSVMQFFKKKGSYQQ